MIVTSQLQQVLIGFHVMHLGIMAAEKVSVYTEAASQIHATSMSGSAEISGTLCFKYRRPFRRALFEVYRWRIHNTLSGEIYRQLMPCFLQAGNLCRNVTKWNSESLRRLLQRKRVDIRRQMCADKRLHVGMEQPRIGNVRLVANRQDFFGA